MRCDNCQRFTGEEPGDIEVESLDIKADGTVQCRGRFTANCSECGSEIKSFDFDMQADPPAIAAAHQSNGCELKVEEGDSELSDTFTPVMGKRGKPTKATRHMFTMTIDYGVWCACQPVKSDALWIGIFEDSIESGTMDESQ